MLILTNESTTTHGGIQRFVDRLARTLAERGEPIILLEPRPSAGAVRDSLIKYHYFSDRKRLMSVCTAWFATVSSLLKRRTKPTLAAIWFPSGIVAALIPRGLRGNLGILAHGTEIAPSRGGFRKSLMRWTFARADAVFANSSATRSLLLQSGVTSNIHVVGCGVDDRRLSRAMSAEPTFLGVGRLIERKGFDRMIQALPAILERVPSATYRIVGDGPLRQHLVESAISLGLAEKVIFLGALSDADLSAEYDRAWCFAMPCRRIGDDVEGFGIVYLEAAMAGLASIGGKHSGAEDAIEDRVTGILVDGNDTADIARASLDLIKDRETAERFGYAARERARRDFSWGTVAASISEILLNA